MNEKLSELQDELKSSAQKIWLAGLGALSMAGEEGKKHNDEQECPGRKFPVGA